MGMYCADTDTDTYTDTYTHTDREFLEGGGVVGVVCQEFRAFGSVRETFGGKCACVHRRNGVFGRSAVSGKRKYFEIGSKLEIYPYLFNHHYGFQQP